MACESKKSRSNRCDLNEAPVLGESGADGVPVSGACKILGAVSAFFETRVRGARFLPAARRSRISIVRSLNCFPSVPGGGWQ